MNVDPIATGIGGIFAGLVTGITSILAVLRRAKSDDLKTQADVQAAVGAFSVDFIKELKDRVANLEREQVVERQRCDERLRDLDEKVIEERRSSDRKIAARSGRLIGAGALRRAPRAVQLDGS